MENKIYDVRMSEHCNDNAKTYGKESKALGCFYMSASLGFLQRLCKELEKSKEIRR